MPQWDGRPAQVRPEREAELLLEAIHLLSTQVEFFYSPCLDRLEVVHFTLPDTRWRAMLPGRGGAACGQVVRRQAAAGAGRRAPGALFSTPKWPVGRRLPGPGEGRPSRQNAISLWCHLFSVAEDTHFDGNGPITAAVTGPDRPSANGLGRRRTRVNSVVTGSLADPVAWSPQASHWVHIPTVVAAPINHVFSSVTGGKSQN